MEKRYYKMRFRMGDFLEEMTLDNKPKLGLPISYDSDGCLIVEGSEFEGFLTTDYISGDCNNENELFIELLCSDPEIIRYVDLDDTDNIDNMEDIDVIGVMANADNIKCETINYCKYFSFSITMDEVYSSKNNNYCLKSLEDDNWYANLVLIERVDDRHLQMKIEEQLMAVKRKDAY